MNRAVALLLAGGLSACGPKQTPPPTPPVATTTTPTPAEVSEPAAPDAAPPPAATAEVSAEPQACEGKVADVPSALFGEHVLIRPPPGVELVEERPGFAISYGEAVSTCDGMVQRMWIAVVNSTPGRNLASYRSQYLKTLGTQGYASPVVGEPLRDNTESLFTPVDFPATEGQAPAKVLLTVSRRLDKVAVVFYQTAPEQWPALSESFVKSAESVLVLPPES